MTNINTKFVDEAKKVFLEKQRWILPLLKDTSVTNTSGGDTCSSPSHSHSTRTEYVKLPSFKGKEKSSPYLNFPTWKCHWDNLIEGYDEKWSSVLLYDHTYEAARSRFTGYETDYKEAMIRLNEFYGDHLKVIMKEVNVPHTISDGDYKGLLFYSSILEQSYNR